MNSTILITGTTSGLGEALLRHYSARGDRVIGFNRRESPAHAAEFPRAKFIVGDITNASEVEAALRSFSSSGWEPDAMVLNAGINEVDNDAGLDLETFRKVLKIDLDGVLTFVEAAKKLGWKRKKIVGISSTSTIVPNSKNLAYYVSKKAMNDLFKIFSRCDLANDYKVVILGPVRTNLNRNLPAPTGLPAKIFAFLAQDSGPAAARCARFIESGARVQWPPFLTSAFYAFLKTVLIFRPGIYYQPYRKLP